MDDSQPAHRLVFATSLRDLRRECGQPPYRVLSPLAHCGTGPLSEAASGRRLPSWETTRGYVTGCLRHAGRDAEIDLLLPRWRQAWEEATTRERAGTADPPRAPAVVPARAPWPRRTAALLVTVVLTAMTAAAGVTPALPAPMTGLYNILVAPFGSAPAVQLAFVRNLRAWAAGDTAIETRGPAGVRPGDLGRLAADHHADVAVTGRLHTAGDRATLSITLVLTDRVFSETPEFVGRHEFRLDEPADVVRGNIEVSRNLADDALSYVKAVVAFVRGLGRYALDDYPGAEREFRSADRDLTRVTAPSEVVQLMLGNAVGRDSRFAEAATAFRRALQRRPDYVRAAVGLAEALRAGAGCAGDDPRGDDLREAIGHYRAALPVAGDALLEMKARLGLGLTHQCLAIAGDRAHWTEADVEFTAVQGVQQAAGLTAEAGRQALRLAAEARAGQALTAHLTGEPVVAARAYREAITMLDRMGVDRPTIRQRELIFLRNLRAVYAGMGAAAELQDVDARIRVAGG
ncbi:tetratricopeptide repeat protein [Actinoplanes rectilineatus]|uniref:tetratricopeptide repeat protein n=1 Tax=Actinoplanes rectilineatus TaxID=113571 RepID=UPI0005F2A79C|nr:tetratricopeptide repeat protein [Actinoplanes rectilineatus]